MNISYDSIAKPVPEGLAPPEAWPEYGTVAMPKTVCRREEIRGPVFGIRWGLWPFYFEEYISDEEPDLSYGGEGELTYSRFVAWKRLRRNDTPQGWHTLSKRSWRIDAYRELSSTEDYTATWNKNARHNLRLWQAIEKEGGYRIEDISLEEFATAYRTGMVAQKIGDELVRVLERKFQLPGVPEHFSIWGVRNTKTGALVAATAAAHSPTYRTSIRECSFITPEARKIYAATALMNHWFAHARARGAEKLFFTHFWQKGEPRDWKGFSEFKSHFGLTYITYPPTLWKFVPGKLF